jgi:hypothetical protein
MCDHIKQIGPYYDGLERGKAEGIHGCVLNLVDWYNSYRPKAGEMFLICVSKKLDESNMAEALEKWLRKYGYKLVKVEDE